MKNSNDTIGNRTRDLPTCASTSCARPRICYTLFSTLIIYIVLVYGWGLDVQCHKNLTTSRNHKVYVYIIWT